MAEKIVARLIIEIMGRPPEHITQTLNELVERMSGEQGIKIVDKQFHEPNPVENTDNLFTAFADVEAEFDNVRAFFGIVFSYMPANIELVSPERLDLVNGEITELSNFILQRLHQYDSIAKRLVAERDVLVNRLNHLTGKSSGPTNKPSVKKASDKAEKKETKKPKTKKKKSSKKK